MQLPHFITESAKMALPVLLGAACTTSKTAEELCLDDARGITSDVHAEVFNLTADCITLQLQDANHTPITTEVGFGCMAESDDGSIWTLGENANDITYEGIGVYEICGLNGTTQVECYELSTEDKCESQITLE